MTLLATLEQTNAQRWAQMKLRPERVLGLQAVAKRLVSAKARYEKVQARLITLGYYVPWWVIAVLHERESKQNWHAQLAQGDPLVLISTHDPKGRGPFYGPDAWERSCFDALIDCPPHAATWKDWTPGGALTILEEYNGLGYAQRGIPSAYVWSGTDQYEHGKYVADHVYRDNAIDVQEGCAALISCMMQIDPTIEFAEVSRQPQPPPPTASPTPLWVFLLRGIVQWFLRN